MAKILIIDDSPADIRYMTEALRSSGHTLITLNDPFQAEQTVQSEEPDIAFLDIVMPRNGYETLRAIKRLPAARHLKVIFVSSKGADSDVKWGLRQGAVDYLVKPYTSDQIMTVLSRHI